MIMNSTAWLAAVSAILVIFTLDGFAQQKPCLTASKFGPNDQIGNLNYVTPEKTLAASKLVTKGKAASETPPSSSPPLPLSFDPRL